VIPLNKELRAALQKVRDQGGNLRHHNGTFAAHVSVCDSEPVRRVVQGCWSARMFKPSGRRTFRTNVKRTISPVGGWLRDVQILGWAWRISAATWTRRNTSNEDTGKASHPPTAAAKRRFSASDELGSVSAARSLSLDLPSA
jgi:hypothetical protein